MLPLNCRSSTVSDSLPWGQSSRKVHNAALYPSTGPELRIAICHS